MLWSADNQHQVRLRLKLVIPQHQQPDFVLSRLINDCGLAINRFVAQETGDQPKQLDLELQGSIAQMTHGLSDLDALGVVIKGKPNPDGDSWYY